MTKYWLETFDRYFELYNNCFGRKFEYELQTVCVGNEGEDKELSNLQ